MSDKRPCTPCYIPVPTTLTLAHTRQHPQEVSETLNHVESTSQQYLTDKGKEAAAKMPYPSKGKMKLTTAKATSKFGVTPPTSARSTAIPCPVLPTGRPRTAVYETSEDKQACGGDNFLCKESHF